MTSKKMLYVRSDDFWGYDSSEFDAALNFYTYTWVVPKAMFEDMDDYCLDIGSESCGGGESVFGIRCCRI